MPTFHLLKALEKKTANGSNAWGTQIALRACKIWQRTPCLVVGQEELFAGILDGPKLIACFDPLSQRGSFCGVPFGISRSSGLLLRKYRVPQGRVSAKQVSAHVKHSLPSRFPQVPPAAMHCFLNIYQLSKSCFPSCLECMVSRRPACLTACHGRIVVYF